MAQLSKPGWLVYQGRPLTQTGQVRVNFASNDHEVRTLLLGLEGFSNGAEEVSIEFKNAIPLAGREVDFAAVLLGHADVDFQFVLAGTTLTATGRILTVGESTEVDNPNAQDVTFKGRPRSRLPT
jgi:hypothetical protein